MPTDPLETRGGTVDFALRTRIRPRKLLEDKFPSVFGYISVLLNLPSAPNSNEQRLIARPLFELVDPLNGFPRVNPSSEAVDGIRRVSDYVSAFQKARYLPEDPEFRILLYGLLGLLHVFSHLD